MPMTEEQRNIIEEGLKNFWPISEICKKINKHPATLWRFIQKNVHLHKYKSVPYIKRYKGDKGNIIRELESQILELKSTIKTLVTLLDQKEGRSADETLTMSKK